jgi:hypothetical protein
MGEDGVVDPFPLPEFAIEFFHVFLVPPYVTPSTPTLASFRRLRNAAFVAPGVIK